MKTKKNSKVDVAKKSVLFLQIGFIIVLLVAWRGIEWKTENSTTSVDTSMFVTELEEEDVPITMEEEKIQPEPKPKQQAVEEIKVTDNDSDIPDTILKPLNNDDPVVIPEDIPEVEEEEDIVVPFARIEDVPVFPGCTGDNTAKKKCMSAQITRLINKKFNTDLGAQLNLSGVQRISVQFTIDKNGNITKVRTRAPHPKLEKEAQRVVKLLPKMTPGKQRGKAVGVTYNLPIIFSVE